MNTANIAEEETKTTLESCTPLHVQENDLIKGGFSRKIKMMQGTLERINDPEQTELKRLASNPNFMKRDTFKLLESTDIEQIRSLANYQSPAAPSQHSFVRPLQKTFTLKLMPQIAPASRESQEGGSFRISRRQNTENNFTPLLQPQPSQKFTLSKNTSESNVPRGKTAGDLQSPKIKIIGENGRIQTETRANTDSGFEDHLETISFHDSMSKPRINLGLVRNNPSHNAIGSPTNHKVEVPEGRTPLRLPKLENIKHPSFHHQRRPSNSTSPSDLSSSSWGSNSSPRPQFNAGMEQRKSRFWENQNTTHEASVFKIIAMGQLNSQIPS